MKRLKLEDYEIVCGSFSTPTTQSQKLVELLFQDHCLLTVQSDQCYVWCTRHQLYLLSSYLKEKYPECRALKRAMHEDLLIIAYQLQFAYQSGLTFRNNTFYLKGQSLTVDINIQKSIITYESAPTQQIFKTTPSTSLYSQLLLLEINQPLDHLGFILRYPNFKTQHELELELGYFKPLTFVKQEQEIIKSIMGSSKRSLSVSFQNSVTDLESQIVSCINDLEQGIRLKIDQETVRQLGREYCDSILWKFCSGLK
ncbi:Hypothetical_protein [Hexamita inflata]|uniref:Hypothetical_protein n=1 Tax=Hexamita inflata TaxID=28002 RepID=A0AA86NI78_9EUKA|nr:Hypothetical protein HINF_LOCUS7376 [Hexamita inflata]